MASLIFIDISLEFILIAHQIAAKGQFNTEISSKPFICVILIEATREQTTLEIMSHENSCHSVVKRLNQYEITVIPKW